MQPPLRGWPGRTHIEAMTKAADSNRADGVTGIILAGGRSVRLGRDKALVLVGGRPMIARVADALRPVTDEILVVGRAEDELAGVIDGPVRYVPDEAPDGGPLAGIMSGLAASSGGSSLVVGCDMPFLDPAMLRALAAQLGDYDAVAPVVRGVVQTTHAVYRCSLEAAIRSALRQGVRSPVRFLRRVRTRYVPEEELERLSPGLRSFLGVNTPEEWAAAERLAT